MTMRVRILTEAGVHEFETYLKELATNPQRPVPVQLLTSAPYSAAIDPVAEINSGSEFSDKVTFGQYLMHALAPIRVRPEFDSHVGLWSWLGLCLFDIICPPE